MKTKPLTCLLALTFLFLFSDERVGLSKTINPENDKSFSTFDVEGLMRDDVRHSIEYKRSFCGQYSMRVVVTDSNLVMDKILAKNADLNKLPTYGSDSNRPPPLDRYSIILSKNNSSLIFKGAWISLYCEDVTNDGNPELFASIDNASGFPKVVQYIFSHNELNLLFHTLGSGFLWYEGGIHQKMEDLDGDGVKELNGWRYFWDLIGVCSTCRKSPRKIMCFNGQKYVDCTKNFPELLQQDLNESRKRLHSEYKNSKKNPNLFHTELIFFIATSINLNKKEASLDYIKTNFSQEAFDWAKENMDRILKELGSKETFLVGNEI